ncbi:hypothetical protein PI125_g22512 [Phytophthora idaei]|nr:hypothetical protein PI125_g22512 [Phytophthora idaei]
MCRGATRARPSGSTGRAARGGRQEWMAACSSDAYWRKQQRAGSKMKHKSCCLEGLVGKSAI